jgi:hypothetical protein
MKFADGARLVPTPCHPTGKQAPCAGFVASAND